MSKMSTDKRTFEQTQALLKKYNPKLKNGGNPIFEDFVRTHGFGNNHLHMFNTFLREGVRNCVEAFNGTVKTVSGNAIHYENVEYDLPSYQADYEKKILNPRHARDSGLTYGVDTYVDLVEVSGNREVNRLRRQYIGKIPIMPKSQYCHLTINGVEKEDLRLYGEDPSDLTGYFIVKGSEKAILLQDQLVYDKIINQQNDTYFVSRLTSTIPAATRLIEFSLKRQDVSAKTVKVRLQSLSVKEENKKMKYNSFNALCIFRLLGMSNSIDIMNTIAGFLPARNQHLAKMLFPSIWDISVVDNDVNLIVRKYQNAQTKKAMEIRSDVSKSEFTPEEKLKIVELLMNQDVFPNINNITPFDKETQEELYDRIRIAKINAAAVMIAGLLELAFDPEKKPDDPDSWSNKKLEGPARLCEALFRASFRKMQWPGFNKSKSVFSSTLGNTVTNLGELASRFKTMDLITQSFESSMVSSDWGVKGSGKFNKNYAQTLQRESIYQTWAHIYTVDAPVSRTNHNFNLRMPNDTAQYFIDSVYTSEGAPCGILKNLAMGTLLSEQRPDNYIISFLSGRIDGVTRAVMFKQDTKHMYVLVNTKPIGWVDNETYRKLIELRRNGTIPFDVSIYRRDNYLVIETSASRLVRPVFIVDKITQRPLYLNNPNASFQELLVNGSIEFISPAEQEQGSVKIAEDHKMLETGIKAIEEAKSALENAKKELEQGRYTKKDVEDFEENLKNIKRKNRPFSHLQIDKTMIFGFVSATIPKPECNQGPRNVYAGQMTKQSTSIPHSNHKSMHSLQSYKTSESAVSPLFRNNALSYMELESKGSGHNVNLWMKVTTQTEEDAWKVERDFLLLGGYRGVKYSTLDTKIETKYTHIKLERPEVTSASYKYILDNGLVYIGAPVRTSDVVISKTITAENRKVKDPTTMNVSERGIVTDIKYTKTPTHINVSVKIAWTRIPQKGDKAAPRNAQKGTFGLVVPHWLLPYARDGSGPTFNPSSFCLPTRMTMEYIYEILCGNVSAALCEPVKATAFDPEENHFKYRRILRELGRNPSCTVQAYSGTSGRQLLNKNNAMFRGLVHVMALKHQVEDKIQARTTHGPKSEVNGQPTGGRKKNGGLRFGEMEHDAIICHGAAACARHFLMDASDPFRAAYCECGQTAEYDPTLGTFKKCNKHLDTREIGTYTIPYSYKYLSQIFQCANIDLVPEFITLKEYTRRVLDGTLYSDDKSVIENLDAELEDIEGNSDVFDAMQEQYMDDFEADMGGYDGDYGDE